MDIPTNGYRLTAVVGSTTYFPYECETAYCSSSIYIGIFEVTKS